MTAGANVVVVPREQSRRSVHRAAVLKAALQGGSGEARFRHFVGVDLGAQGYAVAKLVKVNRIVRPCGARRQAAAKQAREQYAQVVGQCGESQAYLRDR